MSTKLLTIWVAGTSTRTATCLEALLAESRVNVQGVLTPAPRVQPKKKAKHLPEENTLSDVSKLSNSTTQTVQSTASFPSDMKINPVHQLAIDNSLKIVLVTSNRIDSIVRSQLHEMTQPDILLVVDFGYFVPKWLLDWPLRAPINIHPSLLPRWRGSSPGQYVVLFGDQQSGVTIMVMNEGFDTGPIITQLPLTVAASWTTPDYYREAFNLVNEHLVDTLLSFNSSTPLTPQPEESPTPVARQLCRDDGFIGWSTLLGLLSGTLQPNKAPLGDISQLLVETQAELGDLYKVIANACKAFSPWPGLWTLAPTTKGEKRLKILSVELNETPHHHLQLLSVQLEGMSPASPRQLLSTIPELRTVI